ncbi:MAG TPA: hypothetical protein P5057_10080 [Acidobacteriota bacterium]|nr:hypothetical protein [Acidobacteriota bacterium]
MNQTSIQILGESDEEVRWGAFGSQDVDVEEAGFHRVPGPPSLLRNYDAAAFARRWRDERRLVGTTGARLNLPPASSPPS